MTPHAEPDPSRCPVCGLANACAVQAGGSTPCWCSDVEIPAEALARIPSDAQGKACLCPRCAAFVEADGERA